MPDLDTELAALRNHLHESISPPDVARVADRARQRTVRRRTQIAVIAAVLAVSAAVPVLRVLPADEPADRPARSVPPTYTVDFADADHGFALDRQCDRQGGTCRLLWTDDGGENWARRDLPAPPADDSAIVAVIVLGPERVAIDRLAPEGGGGERIYSDDAGRTWRTVPAAWDAPTIDSIPVGGVLSLGCASAPGPDNCGQLVVTLPSGGEVRAIAAHPDLFDLVPGPTPTAEGTWWTSGSDPVTQRPMLAVSTDDGRTWRSTSMEVPDARPVTWAVVERDGTLYATASGTVDRTLDLLGVFRSTDGGLTWARTFTPSEGTSVPGFVGSPVLTSDGRLLVQAGGSTFESDAGVTSFAPADDQLSGHVRWTRAGYLNDLSSSGSEFALSTDGREWRRFTVG